MYVESSRKLGLDPQLTTASLHLHNGIWYASCPACGYQVASGRVQQRVERKARHRSCPVCKVVLA
jgi:NAD-dependent SIR2 family protein deacetylase